MSLRKKAPNQIALDIAQLIRDKQKAGRFCVLALAAVTLRAMTMQTWYVCTRKRD